MEVIPAIDIRGGRCVRLAQGDYARETVFGDDPVAMARRWAAEGATRIHVVDLDGARDGLQTNAAIVRAIAEAVATPVQTGGGIRTLAALRATLEGGVQRVVIGTAAVKDPALLRDAVALAGDRLIVSVDARDGMVSLEGWTETTELDALEFVARLVDAGVRRIVYTDIARDGVEGGPNVEAYARLLARTDVRVIAAGGVGSLGDLRALAAAGVEGAIVGRALYTGDVALREAMAVAGAAARA
ncbi:MAG: 1-(5-phosphoribosyl)-5-[(5-phosphoribosylamino)methylideneamino]imidazole-4-carboxamide isomerase [Dehalococcoidia bacterium]|nr:1-(5-phosphoribosyl)-5-[(5-phosphoribosylamino)methylideneamino]imidazole-4-carboxamide isomerase [Dehalococcoidia bacterium]